jgi:hypothetical protein
MKNTTTPTGLSKVVPAALAEEAPSSFSGGDVVIAYRPN